MTSEPPPERPHEPGPAPGSADGAPSAAGVPEPPPEAAPEPLDERRLHPAATVIDAIRHLRSAVAAMIVVIVSQGLARGAAIVGVLLLIGVIAAFVQWRTTRYAVVDRTLRLRTGVFSKNERNVPASRISALDTSRGLLQRIFGVVALQVQTAGGKKDAEISLRAVSFAEAERLRHALGHRADAGTAPAFQPGAAAAPGSPARDQDADAAAGHGPATGAEVGGAPAQATDGAPSFLRRDGQAVGPGTGAPAFTGLGSVPDPAPVVYSMAPRELIIAALTSPSVAVVGAAGAAAFSLGSDALPDDLQRQVADTVSDLTIAAAAVLVGVGLVLAAIISVVGTILLYGGFTVTRDAQRLRVRRGVLTERVGTIPIDRIHGVRIIEAPLRQLLGYAAIEVEVAGYAGQDEVTRTLIPLVRRDAIPELLRQVVPRIHWPEEALEAIPVRARRRYLWPPLMFAAPFAIALVVAPIGWARVLAVLPVALAFALGRLEARDAGWQLSGGTLVLRWRNFARITLLADSVRLQRMQATTNPFQRRAALGTFGVRLSNARTAQIRHLDAEAVHGLLARTGR